MHHAQPLKRMSLNRAFPLLLLAGQALAGGPMRLPEVPLELEGVSAVVRPEGADKREISRKIAMDKRTRDVLPLHREYGPAARGIKALSARWKTQEMAANQSKDTRSAKADEVIKSIEEAHRTPGRTFPAR